ncbi:ribosome-binding factor A [Mesorhizobium soli]|uniref:TniQ family protein n=1 Tax=Pseudaminobacter soli (ex Li et al. 2025) TaxID=1295366 RepID=UPI002474B95F|nr:TniQ family protein [Mesorhizobium soli]MDH6231606.1 ribosome-binding factor A [Mesorhizobium soli]
MVLPVPVVFHPDEIPESLCDRLSAANGFSSMKLFMSMTGIDARGLERGESQSIARLSHWSGDDPTLLARYRVTTMLRRLDWQLGAAIFNKGVRRGNRFRYCPMCVVNDMETGRCRHVSRPYVRVGWLTRAVRNCTRHRCPLVEKPTTARTGDSFCRFVAANLGEIEHQAAATVADFPVALDSYVEDRISGILQEQYLDRFEAHVAIDLCTHLGRFVKRHPPALSLLPPDLRSAPSREIGFFLARQGELKIRSTVAWIIERERPKGRARFLFGSLGRWLRNNSHEPEFAEVLELFQDIAERNLPYGPGEMCFVPVRRRYLHSVKSASIEYGLFADRTLTLVKQAGLIEDDTSSHARIYFDAEKAHDILVAASRTITSQEAKRELGATERVMSRILQAGLLRRVEARDGIRNYSRIRREDLDDFRTHLFANVAISEDLSSLSTIVTVCQKAFCDVEDVLSAVMSGRISGVAAKPNHGHRLDSLRFDLDEAIAYFSSIRATLSDIASNNVMSQRDASVYMHVKATTIPYLIDKGLLETGVINNPFNNRRQTVVTVASIDAFRTEHIPVSEVASFYETHPIVILDLFAKIGVHPIYDNCGNVSRFFRRSDIIDAPIVIPRFKKR